MASCARRGTARRDRFTLSIFITNLAFQGQPELINSSKVVILITSLAAALLGAAWLSFFGYPVAIDVDPETMDLEEGPIR